MAKEKAEKRMNILNPEEGGLVETAIQWNMRPERMIKYLNEGYDLDEINNFI